MHFNNHKTKSLSRIFSIVLIIIINTNSISYSANKIKKRIITETIQPKILVNIEDGKDVAFEMGDSIYVNYNKGIGLSYNFRKENKKIFAFLGNHNGMELGEIGFRDYKGPAVNVFGVCENGIQGSARKTGNTEVGFWISDPEGMVLQGKDNLSSNFALRVTSGSTQIGNGTNLFTVRNNGQTTISGNLGILNEHPTSTLEINGTFAPKVMVVSTRTILDEATTYVYDGTTDENFILPIIETTKHRMYYIKNRSSKIIKLSCSGNNLIYSTKAMESININPGESLLIQNDGFYWITL